MLCYLILKKNDKILNCLFIEYVDNNGAYKFLVILVVMWLSTILQLKIKKIKK